MGGLYPDRVHPFCLPSPSWRALAVPPVSLPSPLAVFRFPTAPVSATLSPVMTTPLSPAEQTAAAKDFAAFWHGKGCEKVKMANPTASPNSSNSTNA